MQGKTINGFTLKRQLGVGGMAEVWYAENKIGKKAAVKLLLPKLCQDENVVSRFLTEAKVMVDLNHPNIRQVYDYGDIDGRPTIVMEYLEGDDLKARMKRGQRFTDEELKKWWNQLVDALNYTHKKGIVHRDIKPGNIFVDQEGNIKLLDFGIAKVRESISSTQTGQKLGTLMYMSPEQVKDSKHIDYHTDVYSLAVTYVHLLTGKKPYNSDTTSDFEISEQIVYKPLDLSGVPAQWQGFLAPYLNKEPNQRPALRCFEEVSAPVDTVDSDDEGTMLGDTPMNPPRKEPVPPMPRSTSQSHPQPSAVEPATQEPKGKSKKGLWIGLGVAAAALIIVLIVVLSLPKNDVAGIEEVVDVPFDHYYHYSCTFVDQSHDAKVKEKNILNIFQAETGRLMVNGVPCDISLLKNRIVDFLTPDAGNVNKPDVEYVEVGLLEAVCVSKGIVSLVSFASVYDKAAVVNEIAKAYYELRDRVALTMFNKHLNQLWYDQLESIGKAVPARVVGVGEYGRYTIEVVENDVVENVDEINNKVIEVCTTKRDDLDQIKEILEVFPDVFVFDDYTVNNGVIENDKVFTAVEEMPEFPGGQNKLLEYLAKNIKYPSKAREADIQGKVFVHFVIEKDGSVSDVNVVKGIGGGCDEEAARVVRSMPKWKPGKQRGNPVRVSFTLPIAFKLQ